MVLFKKCGDHKFFAKTIRLFLLVVAVLLFSYSVFGYNLSVNIIYPVNGSVINSFNFKGGVSVVDNNSYDVIDCSWYFGCASNWVWTGSGYVCYDHITGISAGLWDEKYICNSSLVNESWCDFFDVSFPFSFNFSFRLPAVDASTVYSAVNCYDSYETVTSSNVYFDVQPRNYTINFVVWDEETNSLISQPFNFQFISNSFSFNMTQPNASISIDSIETAEYEIRYYTPYGDYTYPRSYFTTLESEIINNSIIRLYAVIDNVSNYLVPLVVDQYGLYIPNATITLLRGQFEDGAYVGYPVEMSRTDSEGKGLLRLIPNIVYYKFFVDAKERGTLTTPYFKITSSSLTLQTNIGSNPLNSLRIINDVGFNLVFNNISDTFTMNWYDKSRNVIEGCLIITKIDGFGIKSIFSSNCVNGNIGSISSMLSNYTNSSFTAVATIKFSDGTNRIDSLTVDFRKNYENLGLFGVLFAFIFVLFLVGLAGASAEGIIIGGVGAIVILGLFGFIFYSWTAVIGVIIIGIIIIYKMNKM